MLLLVTGASGAGKSTARLAIADQLAPSVECVELGGVVPIPTIPTLAWRQQSVEVVVRRAIHRQAEGGHLLFCGDPVVAGELLAAPSAPELEAIAICLLDIRPDRQRERLARRGEPEASVVHHVAFAEWLRGHARDPRYRPEVITTNAWDQMRWDRWRDWEAGDPRWSMSAIDTSDLPPAEAAAALLRWCKSALTRNEAPILTGCWWNQ